MFYRLWLLAALALPATGAMVVGEVRLGRAVNESRCTVTQPAQLFGAKDAQVFVQFVARGLAGGESLRIEWVAPEGGVHDTAEYEQLPAAPALCFTSALALGGAPASMLPGVWRVRVVAGSVAVAEKEFRVEGTPDDGSPRILSLRHEALEEGRLRLEIQAWRADAETSVNLAQFKPEGGWTYIAHLLPDRIENGRISVQLPALAPARYLVLLRGVDGRMSPPASLEMFSGTGYYLPGVAGEAWRITQRPYGTYSHWGRSIHAWDLAPVRSRLVTAMRGGVVHARDRGEHQNVRSRSFGNYITIDHGDGEYSHYAHLRTGTFLVKSGDRVAAGQPLAEVGNSGYSFGTHVHVHVTRAFPIAAQSIPFRFADLPEGRPAVVISRNYFQGASGAAQPPPANAVGGRPPRWQGTLSFAEWWSEPLNVPRGTKEIEFRHGAREGAAAFDLHAVSPSGKRYVHAAAESDEPLRIATPEPGNWRVWLQAVAGHAREFWVDAELRR